MSWCSSYFSFSLSYPFYRSPPILVPHLRNVWLSRIDSGLMSCTLLIPYLSSADFCVSLPVHDHSIISTPNYPPFTLASPGVVVNSLSAHFTRFQIPSLQTSPGSLCIYVHVLSHTQPPTLQFSQSLTSLCSNVLFNQIPRVHVSANYSCLGVQIL